MALKISRDVRRMVQFHLHDTNEVVQVESRFIGWMAKLVQVGERHAITVNKALKLLGVKDTDYHRRQWRYAADFWQEAGVLVSATTRGYFIPATERERARQVSFKQVTIEALERRKKRLLNMPLGKGFDKYPVP